MPDPAQIAHAQTRAGQCVQAQQGLVETNKTDSIHSDTGEAL